MDKRLLDAKVARALGWQNVRYQPHQVYPDTMGEWIGESDDVSRKVDFVPYFHKNVQLCFSWIIHHIKDFANISISYVYKDKSWMVMMHNDDIVSVQDGSLPLAICLAFLKFMKVNGNGQS